MATILLIDDNAIASALRANVLATHGHSAQIALDGATGITLAEALRPDLIVLDHNLPDMNGAEVFARLKGLLPATPVIVLSGYDLLPDIYDPAPDAVLVKGDSVQQLPRIIEELLP